MTDINDLGSETEFKFRTTERPMNFDVPVIVSHFTLSSFVKDDERRAFITELASDKLARILEEGWPEPHGDTF